MSGDSLVNDKGWVMKDDLNDAKIKEIQKSYRTKCKF